MPTETSIQTKPHFSLLATSFAGGPRPRNAAIILFGLWFLLFFAALFSPPILDDADATHAQAARAMASTGDLVTLKVDGVRYLEKAPMIYWLAALSFRIFGFNTFAAHLPQALAVLLLMLLGHRWANQAFGARTGFYTALAVLTSAGVFLFTRILIPEVLLSLLLCSALFAFLKTLGPVSAEPASPQTWVPHLRDSSIVAKVGIGGADRSRPSGLGTALSQSPSGIRERPSIAFYAGPLFYPYLMWATLAFAVLTKGLVALVFFFATTLAFLILTGTLRKDWRKLRPFTGLLLLLAIAAPWHILAGLRNAGGLNGHGFFWFYFVNEHVMRFVGKRIPADYNKLPGYLYWLSNLIWLFPWTLFLPLGITALYRRFTHQTQTLTAHTEADDYLPRRNRWLPTRYEISLLMTMLTIGGATLIKLAGFSFESYFTILLAANLFLVVPLRRRRTGLTASPFHRIDPQQRSILLLSLFAAIVLLFFSLSTNQEYYTFPAYLPLLLLIAATITRAEQTFSTNPQARRAITFAHAAFAALGAAFAIALFYGLWASRKLPYLADIGLVLAHRGIGDYTLSLSHFFDLTTPSFAALRLPALLAGLAFAFGPALAWLLRVQRRHIAATTCIGLTSAIFLFAAHIAFARFAPMLSSEPFAARIQQLEATHRIAPETQVAILGDQAFGSSIPFYLGRPVLLVDARTTSMFFGSTFADVPPVFVPSPGLRAIWGNGPRKILFVPLERRAQVLDLFGPNVTTLLDSSGKLLITDRPLEP